MTPLEAHRLWKLEYAEEHRNDGVVVGFFSFIIMALAIVWALTYIVPWSRQDGPRQFVCWAEDIRWPWESWQPTSLYNCVEVDHVAQIKPGDK